MSECHSAPTVYKQKRLLFLGKEPEYASYVASPFVGDFMSGTSPDATYSIHITSLLKEVVLVGCQKVRFVF